ncbi:hypothetical protein [Pseudoxanthomonas mexicana]|jgi:hypothetical protein
MTTRATVGLDNAELAAAKAELDGGFCFLFAGPEPDSADEALDMGALHTEVVKLSLGGDGVTGLVFDAPSGGVLAKPNAANWSGLVAFSGAESGETTLVPTFYRFCPAGDNGRGAATTPRLQGSVGGPNSSANVRLSTNSVTANGSNTQALAGFTYSHGDA